LHPYPRRIIQTPGLLVILFERDMVYRQIATGRPLPKIHGPAKRSRLAAALRSCRLSAAFGDRGD